MAKALCSLIMSFLLVTMVVLMEIEIVVIIVTIVSIVIMLAGALFQACRCLGFEVSGA